LPPNEPCDVSVTSAHEYEAPAREGTVIKYSCDQIYGRRYIRLREYRASAAVLSTCPFHPFTLPGFAYPARGALRLRADPCHRRGSAAHLPAPGAAARAGLGIGSTRGSVDPLPNPSGAARVGEVGAAGDGRRGRASRSFCGGRAGFIDDAEPAWGAQMRLSEAEARSGSPWPSPIQDGVSRPNIPRP
jgi:hypothetical protein